LNKAGAIWIGKDSDGHVKRPFASGIEIMDANAEISSSTFWGLALLASQQLAFILLVETAFQSARKKAVLKSTATT